MSRLDREVAPFDSKVWEVIDGVARRAVLDTGVARRLLRVVGPLGMDARVGIGEDEQAGEEEAGSVGGDAAATPHVHMPRVRILPLLHAPFRMGLRAIEAFETRGEPLDTRAIAEAARVLAEAEDALVFEGDLRTGIRGLVGGAIAGEIAAGDWSEPANVSADLLGALSALDDAGRHGPFAAALPPARYYALFRPFPGTSLTPHAQLAPLFEGGIHKAPTLRDTFVVLVRDEAGPKLMLGQDLAAAYDGREGVFHRFSLLESATVLPGSAGSVVLLRGATLAHPRPADLL